MLIHHRSTAVLTVVAAVLVVAVGVYLGLRVIGDRDGSGSASPSQAPTSTSVATASETPSTEMFAAPPPAASAQPTDTALGVPVRSRYVSFNSTILPATAAGQQLTFAFFPDATFVGTVQTIDRQSLLTSWSGPLNLADSIFVVTKTADRYQVTLSTTRGSFTMNLTSAGLYQVEEVDQPAVLDNGGASPVSPGSR